jgi:hypothetical protein
VKHASSSPSASGDDGNDEGTAPTQPKGNSRRAGSARSTHVSQPVSDTKSVEPTSPTAVDVRKGTKDGVVRHSMTSNAPSDATVNRDLPSTMGLHLADFSVDIPDLEKMRTFPSSVPLPDLDGDLEFLDFFDPFLGLPPKQVEAFALPPLNMEGWSPLENFSGSSQTSMQDYEFQQNHLLSTHASPLLDDTSQAWVTGNCTNTKREQYSVSWEDTPAQNFASARTDSEGLLGVPGSQTRSSKQPVLVFTESMRTHLLQDLFARLPAEQLNNFRLPTAAALQKCIRTYVDAFHVHLPIFHLPTMDLKSTPSPLILAICAIGAQYRLERKVSAALFLKADQALAAAVVDRGDHLHKKPRLLEDWVRPRAQPRRSTPDALWKGQTRLLLAMLSCFSGDTEVISKAIVHLGDFLMVRMTAKARRPRVD